MGDLSNNAEQPKRLEIRQMTKNKSYLCIFSSSFFLLQICFTNLVEPELFYIVSSQIMVMLSAGMTNRWVLEAVEFIQGGSGLLQTVTDSVTNKLLVLLLSCQQYALQI